MTLKTIRTLGVLVLIILLAGCGGGGGTDTSAPIGNNPVTTPNTNAGLSTDSATLNATAILGVTPAVTLTGKILDRNGIAIRLEEQGNDHVFGPARITINSDGSFTGVVPVQATATGNYSGNLVLRLCGTLDCSILLPTTPVTLPYTLDVEPATQASGVSVLSSTTQSIELDILPDRAVSVEFDIHSSIALPQDTSMYGSSTAFPAPDVQIVLSADRRSGHVTVHVPAYFGAPNPVGGMLDFSVCLVAGCTQRYGADLHIPWQAHSHVAQPALSAISGAYDWSGIQGNAMHTGAVPVTLNPAAFSLRWLRADSIASSPYLNQVATGNGSVYLREGGNLVAISEDRGVVQWSVTDDPRITPTVSAPAYYNGMVFYTASDQFGGTTWVNALNSGTGARVWQRTGPQGPSSMAPPVFNQGSVYAVTGVFVGTYNLLTGASGLNWAYGTSFTDVAVDGQNVYFWNDVAQSGVASSSSDNVGVLAIANENSAASPRGYPIHNLKAMSVTAGSPPVLGAMQDLLIATSMPMDSVNYRSNDLLSINTQTGTENWRYVCTCTGAPAVAQGRVFVANNESKALEVLDESTGTLLWYWPLPAGINGESTRGSPLVANNLAFVSSTFGTYAIDLQTHQKVWSTSYTGALSLSANGVLYIYSPNIANQSSFGPQTTLAAFNLH